MPNAVWSLLIAHHIWHCVWCQRPRHRFTRRLHRWLTVEYFSPGTWLNRPIILFHLELHILYLIAFRIHGSQTRPSGCSPLKCYSLCCLFLSLIAHRSFVPKWWVCVMLGQIVKCCTSSFVFPEVAAPVDNKSQCSSGILFVLYFNWSFCRSVGLFHEILN